MIVFVFQQACQYDMTLTKNQEVAEHSGTVLKESSDVTENLGIF